MSSTSQESEPSTNAPDERSRLVWNANPETAEPRRAKILLVEDEAIVALDIKTRLLHLGHEVVGVTSSGEDAIKIVEATRPDLVLMDIRLRGRLDGIEAAQQLRAQFDVAVIYLTAYGDDATLQRAKLTEPYGFLIKPFEERELHSTIEMAFYKSMMEKRVQQQIRRLQRTISTFPEGVALLDADNRIVMANPKAQAYLLTLSGATVGDLVERLGNATLAAFIEARDTGGWQDILSLDSPSRTFEAIATSLNTELDPLPVDVEGGRPTGCSSSGTSPRSASARSACTCMSAWPRSASWSLASPMISTTSCPASSSLPTYCTWPNRTSRRRAAHTWTPLRARQDMRAI